MNRRDFNMLMAAAVGGLVAGAATPAFASDPEGEKAKGHDCAGKNECKGQGGCKTGDNGCAGKNSCKGKGGCAVKAKETEEGEKAKGHDCAGKNECKGQGGCASAHQ